MGEERKFSMWLMEMHVVRSRWGFMGKLISFCFYVRTMGRSGVPALDRVDAAGIEKTQEETTADTAPAAQSAEDGG